MDEQRSTEQETAQAGLTADERQRAIDIITELEERKSHVTAQNGVITHKKKPQKPPITDFGLLKVQEVEEKEPEWLIPGYIPKGQITVLAGDGGAGKTSVWCAISAAVSSGAKCFLNGDNPFLGNDEPQKVLFFSSEDSVEYTLKGRLRKNGANMDNLLTMRLSDERFAELKFNTELLESLIREHKPALVVFDPIQSFVPTDIQMGQRNEMRDCLNGLIGLGEKYGSTFLIVVHTNKQSNIWGRKRIADSADIWDIARSVLIVGEADEEGTRYISHEKSNYGEREQTVLFRLDSGEVKFQEYSEKRDRDFVAEASEFLKQNPQREEVKAFILEYLSDGQKEVSELDDAMKALGVTKATLGRAKTDLKKEGRIEYKSIGFGKERKSYWSLRQPFHAPSPPIYSEEMR